MTTAATRNQRRGQHDKQAITSTTHTNNKTLQQQLLLNNKRRSEAISQIQKLDRTKKRILYSIKLHYVLQFYVLGIMSMLL